MRARTGRKDLALALVLGDVDLVRPLALGRIPCAVFATADDAVRWSRHPTARLPFIDHWTRQEEVVDSLLAWAGRQRERPVLMPQSDGDLVTVSRHRDQLAGRFRFALAQPDLIEALVDKARFADLARRLDLPIPRARHVAPATDSPSDLDLRFPVVVKPVVRQYAPWARVEPAAKARSVDGPEALARLWPQLAGADIEVLVQEAVPGPETRVESHHAYIDFEGAVAAEFTGRKIRTWPAQYGHSTSLELTAADDVAALGREVLATLGVTGVAKTDFKRAPDGSLRLLEVNPRFTLWHHPAALAGINVPAIVHADLTGRPRPPRQPLRPGVRWCIPLADARAARAQGMGMVRWLRFLASCEARSGAAWDDPLPLIASVWGVAHGRFRRL